MIKFQSTKFIGYMAPMIIMNERKPYREIKLQNYLATHSQDGASLAMSRNGEESYSLCKLNKVNRRNSF